MIVIRSKKQALGILSLPEIATDAEISARLKTLLQAYHPDRDSGDVDRFIEINAVKRFLHRPVCSTCTGTQKVVEKHGRMSTTRECPDCR